MMAGRGLISLADNTQQAADDGATTYVGQGGGPSLAQMQQQAKDFEAQAQSFADAAAWARSQGLQEAADRYQEEATKNWYVSHSLARSAFNQTANSQAAMPKGVPPSPFQSADVTGNYSAGLDPTVRTWAPDYVTGGANYLNGSAGGVVNTYNGNVYSYGSVNKTPPSMFSTRPGLQATAGYIFGVHDAEGADNFINGNSVQGYVSIPTPWNFNVLGAVTHAVDGPWAVEAGVGTKGDPAAGVAVGNSKLRYDPSRKQEPSP